MTRRHLCRLFYSVQLLSTWLLIRTADCECHCTVRIVTAETLSSTFFSFLSFLLRVSDILLKTVSGAHATIFISLYLFLYRDRVRGTRRALDDDKVTTNNFHVEKYEKSESHVFRGFGWPSRQDFWKCIFFRSVRLSGIKEFQLPKKQPRISSDFFQFWWDDGKLLRIIEKSKLKGPSGA